MEPQHRVVTELPLTELWTEHGSVDAERICGPDEEGVRRILSREPLQFVVANPGLPLRWTPIAERFTFWKSEVQPHLVDPSRRAGFSPYDYPDGYCYVASEWVTLDRQTVVVLELHR